MVRRGLRATALRGVLTALVAASTPGLAHADEADAFAAPEQGPSTIFNGLDAAQCAFPSAVGMLDRDTEDLFCTGTLIHPQVVLFAAHCMDPESSWATPGSIMFGEDVEAPVRQIPVEDCIMHPEWLSAGIDLAACTLPVAVRQVPIVPVIMGCEVDALQPDTMVTIVGFGATSGIVDEEGGVSSTGAGRKRFTEQRITDVLVNANDVVMVGPNTGGCFGDSGGPAFARLGDGTWRVIGAASTLHPQSPEGPDGEICGFGTVYEIVWTHMAWLEEFAGFDLTPCHDTDGTWRPGPECGGFPFEPGVPETSWKLGCEVANIGAWSSSCGAPFSDGPFPSPGPVPEPPPPEPVPEPPPPDPVPEPPPPPPADSISAGDDEGRPPLDPGGDPESETASESESDDDDGGGVGESDLADRGCGCRDTERSRAPLALLLLALLRRRRGARRPGLSDT
jgi:hypothetical protein